MARTMQTKRKANRRNTTKAFRESEKVSKIRSRNEISESTIPKNQPNQQLPESLPAKRNKEDKAVGCNISDTYSKAMGASETLGRA